MQLQEQLSVVGEPVRRGVDEPPVRSESVSGAKTDSKGSTSRSGCSAAVDSGT
ncbi:MAG: hypothetical protein ACRDNR_11680 [Gaiellaceae bacterium]